MILSSKKMFTLILMCVLLSITAVWGLRMVIYTGASTLQVEETVGPIKLVMNLEKVTYKVGENINITLEIVNVSNATLTLGYVSNPKVDFVIYSEFSDIGYAYAGEHGFAGYARNITLEPRELFGQTLTWDQKARSSPETPLQQVPLGTYYVFGRLGFGLYAVEPAEQELQEFHQLKTPRIQIQISG